MKKNTMELKQEFQRLVDTHLNYSVLSIMTFDEYKEFVIFFFTTVNMLREQGLVKEDVERYIQKNYSDVISNFNDDDDLFERRFEVFNEELIEFCPSPFFWNTDFDVYMHKWYRAFDSYWFKAL